MSAIKRLVAAGFVGVALSCAGPLTGIGLPTASALYVTQNVDMVKISLDSGDVSFVNASGAPALCTFEVFPPLDGFITVDLSYIRCIQVLELCVDQDPTEAPVDVLVTDDSVACLQHP